MKIIFMGTPDFAVPALKILIKEGHEIPLVITQPDKPRGRGKKESPTPVKELALKYDIPVVQPEKLRKNKEILEQIKQINPDLIVVVAFGQILPQTILKIPRLGCVNIHASLLPKYRGAAPIQWAIIRGEKTTGITIMYMDKGLDTGDMLYKKEIPIENTDTAGTLFDKLKELGAIALKEALPLIECGGIQRQAQNNDEATLAPKIEKELGELNFNMPAVAVNNLIRGLSPAPSAYIKYNKIKIKVHKAKTTLAVGFSADGPAGTILNVDKNGILVNTIKGLILIEEIQAPNKKTMPVSEYINGNQIEVGYQL
ncbi:methionyl-tRNA formyltransferase [Candidatus Epulonipiscioides gigas]|nr:methionyl-tRNA formyltransferase [Epulopiscium sp. SCG-C07WGA-EpuloA2]